MPQGDKDDDERGHLSITWANPPFHEEEDSHRSGCAVILWALTWVNRGGVCGKVQRDDEATSDAGSTTRTMTIM